MVAGKKAGRESDDEHTYFNAVGLAYVDVSIAHAMFTLAIEAGAGTEVALQERMIFEHENLGEFIRL
jgi:ornithine cyclodeaminase/alanine dehydrogenase-like protein (mu-crystallin family)